MNNSEQQKINNSIVINSHNKPVGQYFHLAAIISFLLTYGVSGCFNTGLATDPANRTNEDSHALHIHFISGSNEYHSEPYMKALKEELENDFRGIKVTATWAEDRGDDLPDIELLAEADLLIVFSRRTTVPEDQLAYIHQHFEAEKPVVGLRTASHAFQNIPEFDNAILGGNYSGHGGDEPGEITIAEGAEEHPVLDGITPWLRYSKIYKNPDLDEKSPNAEILLYIEGLRSGLYEPVAWTNFYGENGRAFYTSMPVPVSPGRPTGDFESENYRQLLFNAIEWVTGQDLQRTTN